MLATWGHILRETRCCGTGVVFRSAAEVRAREGGGGSWRPGYLRVPGNFSGISRFVSAMPSRKLSAWRTRTTRS